MEAPDRHGQAATLRIALNWNWQTMIRNQTTALVALFALAVPFPASGYESNRTMAGDWEILNGKDASIGAQTESLSDDGSTVGIGCLASADFLGTELLPPGTFIGLELGHQVSIETNQILLMYRIDSRDVVSDTWSLSGGEASFVFLHGEAAIQFARALFDAEKLHIRVSSYAETFSLEGVDEVIWKVAAACDWTP